MLPLGSYSYATVRFELDRERFIHTSLQVFHKVEGLHKKDGNVLTPCAGSGGFRLPQESWFITPFIEKKIPFDNSINMTPNDSIYNHARDLAIRISEVARKFGANHANIVAHSKGGLDVRKFLTLIKPGTLGVYSLTTLSTPHAGSPGADYQLDAREAYRRNLASVPDLNLLPGSYETAAFALTNTLVHSDNDLRTALALAVKPNDGTPFLRVDAMRGFNEENKSLLLRSFTVDGVTNKMPYYAISADANLDGSHIGGDIPWQPTITENETHGVPPHRAHIRDTAPHGVHEGEASHATVHVARDSQLDGVAVGDGFPRTLPGHTWRQGER